MNKSRFALQSLWILTLVLLVLQLPDLLLYRSANPVVMGFYDRDYFVFLCLYMVGVVIWSFLTFRSWQPSPQSQWTNWLAARPQAAILLVIIVLCLPIITAIGIVNFTSGSTISYRPWLMVGLLVGISLSISVLGPENIGRKAAGQGHARQASSRALGLSFVQGQKFNLIFAIVLGLLVLAAYAPSIKHLHRSDQWWYLLDMNKADSFVDIWLKSYSYNRTRTFRTGDTGLFRPALFTLLAFESKVYKVAFTTLWQLTGIGLHLILCSLLYRLLVQLQPRVKESYSLLGRMIPASIILFFALNLNSMELVIWSHLNGYILFLVFMVGSLIAFLKYDRTHQIKYLILAWVLALLSAFTYELGQIFAGALAIFYLLLGHQSFQTRLKVCLFLLVIPVVYQVTNRIDYSYHLARGHFVPDGRGMTDMLGSLVSMATVTNTIHFLEFSVMKPYLPALTEVATGDRLLINELYLPSTGGFILSIPSYILFGAWLFLMVFDSGYIFARYAEPKQRIKLVFALALSGAFIAYAGVIVLGRMNVGIYGPELGGNTYYAYMSLVIWIILSFLLWTFTPVEIIRNVFYTRSSRLLMSFLLLVLLLTVETNGLKIYRVNQAFADLVKMRRNQIETITRFVAEHKQEPDFGLAPLPDGDFSMSLFGADFEVAYPIILFKDYIDLYSPTYLLTTEDSEVVFIPAEDYPPGDNQPVYPEVIETQECFIIVYFHDQYWAVPNVKYAFDQSAFSMAPRGFVESNLTDLMPKVEAYTEEHMNYKTAVCN